MDLANVLVMIFLSYYSLYFIKLLRKKERKGIQHRNEKLDEYRNIKVKTLEQQKEFLNYKYPKRPEGKRKIRFKDILHFIYYILSFTIFFQLYIFLFTYFNIDLEMWMAILFVVVVPILINMVLEKFKLQKSDMRVFFK